MDENMPDDFMMDTMNVMKKMPILTDGFCYIALLKGYKLKKMFLQPVLYSINLLQMFMQSTWDSYPLMQVPYFDKKMCEAAASKKHGYVNSITRLANMSERDRRKFFEGFEFNEEMIADANRVLRKVFAPKLAVEATLAVEGAPGEVEEITENSIVTVTIKTRFIAPENNDEDDVKVEPVVDNKNAAIVKVQVAPKKEKNPDEISIEELMKDEELKKQLDDLAKKAKSANSHQRKKLQQQEQSLISKARAEAMKKKEEENKKKQEAEKAETEPVEEEQAVTTSYSLMDEKDKTKDEKTEEDEPAEEEYGSDYDILDHQDEIRAAREKEAIKMEEARKAAEAEDAKQRELSGPTYVHAPFFPEPHKEQWYFVIGDQAKNKLINMTKGPCPTLSDKPESKITMRIPAPDKAGTYHYTLYVMSDSYIGRDVTQLLKMVVAPRKDEPIDDDDDDELDSDLSDEEEDGHNDHASDDDDDHKDDSADESDDGNESD